MGSQVLPCLCQKVRRTFPMAAVYWHVEPVWRHSKTQLVVKPVPTGFRLHVDDLVPHFVVRESKMICQSVKCS